MPSMFRSPNRKFRLKIMGDIKLPIGKRGGSTGGGISGSLHKKRHMNARGLPGTPMGVCLGPSRAAECHCGKHNRLHHA